MKVENKKLVNGDLQIVLTFDAFDQMCLEHDLVDIVEWYAKGPSSEKIHSCRKRMIQENKDKVLAAPAMQAKTMAEVNALMQDEKALCAEIKKLPSYKNRKQREAIV